jgi:hypothetical protein
VRRPVTVNSYCGLVSSYLMISFARIIRQVVAGEAFRAKEIMTFSYSRRCLLKATSHAVVDGARARPRAQSPELDISCGARSSLCRTMPLRAFAFVCCEAAHMLRNLSRDDEAGPASLRATAMMARLFPFLPPRSAKFNPHMRRSESPPNGPMMCCGPCTSTMRRYESPSLN